MSINSAEIDGILAELDLTGQHIQKVIQPDFRNLYLQLFRPPRSWWLRVCLENPYVRFHETAKPPRAKRSHQRFEDFLWSRLRGGRVVDTEHVYRDRIVRLTVERAGERSFLYIRLWGSQANVIVTAPDGTILDAFFRKPKRGIETGGHFVPEKPPKAEKPREIRPISAGRTLNSVIDEEYRTAETAREKERLVARCRRALDKQRRRLSTRLSELEAGLADASSNDRNRHYGDLILANLHGTRTGERWIEVADYADGNRTLRIELDPTRPPADNAKAYYDRARRAEDKANLLEENAANVRTRLHAVERRLERLDDMEPSDLRRMASEVEPATASRSDRAALPGLEFESNGFRILVGRNARENDHLLRRAVRGNDWWLHTRDYPGGYVFVLNRPGKSVPLEALLDAGNLALFFSKARANGRADLYYTQVKYLRRAKHAPVGLVIPTQEKNLAVELDENRLSRLGIGLGLSGEVATQSGNGKDRVGYRDG